MNRPAPNPAFTPVTRLAGRAGVPTEAHTPADGGCYDGPPRPVWNGQHITYLADEPAAYLFHEIAHWAVATPIERRMWDFGLGPAETFRGFNSNGTITRRDNRDRWIGQALLPRHVCRQRETDAVTAFLTMPAFGCGTLDEGFSMWAEFGGDLDGSSDVHTNSFDRVRTAMGEWSDWTSDDWDTHKTVVLNKLAGYFAELELMEVPS